MLSDTQLSEIKNRIETKEADTSQERVRVDRAILFDEVQRLKQFVKDFTSQVEANLATLETDMLRLKAENERLRTVQVSTYFERDACIGLLAQMASSLGFRAGTCKTDVLQENMDGRNELQTQNRVVIDLPSGQVSWDFLDEDAHLFGSLPKYEKPLEQQSVQEVYKKVMSPGLDF